MKRKIIHQLLSWKESGQRKPLILQGARQVGKTYILLEFGKVAYNNTAYINFETNPEIHDLFNGSLKPSEILKNLSIYLSINITSKETLIVFDEIQECPAALNSLKYFNELASEYHICAAGSLLGVTLANSSGFPVGQVDFLNLYPLCFSEFLEAVGEAKLSEYIANIDYIQPLPGMFHDKLSKLFKEYLLIGGMPKAILEYVNSHDYTQIREIQNNILNAYRLDFSKHAAKNIIMKLTQIWDVIPSQLAKENKKFVYSVIRKGARALEFEDALQWLLEAGLVLKVYNTGTPKLPISAYVNHEIFKIYLADMGLLGAMANIPVKTIIVGNELFQEFKGSLTENYIACELKRQGYNLCYWTSNSQAELDFVLQHEDMIMPLEIKSGTSGTKKSLIAYNNKYNPKLAIRVSPLNLKLDGNILNCPLYLFEHLSNLIKLIS